jgi:signal transduction histidine kinase
MRTNHTISIFLVISLLCTILLIYLSHSYFEYYKIQDKEEELSFGIILSLDDLTKSMRDERAAQRAYVSSEDVIDLNIYESAKLDVENKLNKLQIISVNSGKFHEEISALAELISQRQKRLDNSILLHTLNKGRRGEILDYVMSFKNKVVQNYHETSQKQKQRLKIIQAMLIAGSFTTIILFLSIFILLKRDITNREKIEEVLRDRQKVLDEQVAAKTKELSEVNQMLKSEITIRSQTEASLQLLHEHIENFQEEEKIAISRTIHDEIGQFLAAMKLDISWLKHKFLPGNSEVSSRLNLMSETLNQLIVKSQNIIAELRPPLLDSLGLLEAIEWQVEEITEPDSKVAANIVRIVIEALTNISRHTQASWTRVSLSESDESLVVEIADNGHGISPDSTHSPTSYGIMGMRERARFCHGTLTVAGSKENGTTVRLIIPLLNKAGVA